MAGNPFLSLISGVITVVRGVQSSAGAGDAGKIPALDATGRLDSSMMPVGVAAETTAAVASEALSAGNAVNLWNDAGTLKARKADASTTGKEANGFVLATVSLGDTATVYGPSQANTQVTGLTVGAKLWLDPATPGGVTDTPPSTAGQTSQYVGKATAATAYVFDPADPITLA